MLIAIGVPAAVTVLYIAGFPLLAAYLGHDVVGLAALPAGAIAASWGLVPGLMAAPALMLVTVALVLGSGIPLSDAVNPVHPVLLLTLTYGFGTMAELLKASRAQAQRLDRSEATLKAVVSNPAVAVWATDAAGRFTFREGQAYQAASLPASELLGTDARQYYRQMYPDHPELVEHVTAALAGRPTSTTAELGGRVLELTYTPIRGQRGVISGAVAVVYDLTERTRVQRALERRSRFEPLSGTLTRLGFRSAAGDMVARGGHLALMRMELIGLRDITVAYGFEIADELVQLVATNIQKNLPEGAVIGRIGDSDFHLALPRVHRADAIALAEAIASLLSEDLIVRQYPISLVARFGIALMPDHGTSLVTLMGRADVAMYTATELDQTVVVFDPRQDERTRERLGIFNDLHAALEQDDQLYLRYQPKVEIASGRVTGAEALVGWRHPERGELSPAEFVPIAEQNGVMTALDRWVLGAAVRQRCLWSASGLDVDVAVNVSMRSLEDPTFPEFVQGLVRSHCVGKLTIEVTETGIMKDRAQAIRTLDSLARLGVRLSIDDFGTGYSSLSYLRELPVEEFKIDRSFVRDMVSKPSDAAIVASVIGLAHNYGRLVVAEGVEDAATMDALARLGCDVAQGYHISKPLRADGFAAWARSWSSTAIPELLWPDVPRDALPEVATPA